MKQFAVRNNCNKAELLEPRDAEASEEIALLWQEQIAAVFQKHGRQSSSDAAAIDAEIKGRQRTIFRRKEDDVREQKAA